MRPKHGTNRGRHPPSRSPHRTTDRHRIQEPIGSAATLDTLPRVPCDGRHAPDLPEHAAAETINETDNAQATASPAESPGTTLRKC